MVSPSFIFLRERSDGSIYRDNYCFLYRKETRIVITKKVYVTVFNHEKYENVVQELNKLGVNILELVEDCTAVKVGCLGVLVVLPWLNE